MRERRHGKKALSKKDQYQPGGLDGCAAIRIGWKLKKVDERTMLQWPYG